ncbi:MAG: hypothetical protein D6756_11210 [Cyanobacteria bacterium J083]|nr:MAG: hypothetical protein D6756_11210 [Cyanobacteria bacterium J083]
MKKLLIGLFALSTIGSIALPAAAKDVPLEKTQTENIENTEEANLKGHRRYVRRYRHCYYYRGRRYCKWYYRYGRYRRYRRYHGYRRYR